MFTANQEKLNENRPAYMRHPFIGAARLIDVNDDKISQTKETDTLNFVIEIMEEGQYKGAQYRHAYFKPDNEDGAGKMATAIAHILSMFSTGTPEEASAKASEAINASSWEEFKTKVLTMFNERIGKAKYSARTMTWKLTGYISTEGNPRFGFTSYPGFVANEASKSMPHFSQKEMQGNAKYLEALARMQSAAPSTSTSTGDSGSEWGGASSGAPATADEEAPF